ncbi:porin [Thiofilum flexile]|uniref:porin n=1 Tax=Thiofilum flexile TaxID=125627 RepID=UPI000365C91F|nr:porin [Thiofilum flexile]
MRLLGLGIFLLFTTHAQAGALTFYGQIQANYGDVRAKTDGHTTQRQALGSTGSLVGIKGFTPLNHKLDITFMNETRLHLQTHKNNLRSLSNQKQHWVGLRSPYGELRTGKQLMPNQVLTYELDRFQDQFGSAETLIQPNTTVTDSLLYIQRLGKAEIALGYGRDKDTTLSERSVRGGLINYKAKQNWVLGAGVEVKPNTYVDGRLSINFKTDKAQLGALYQHLDTQSTQVQGQDVNALLLNASRTQGNWTLKAQLGRKKDKTASATKLSALGLEYAVNPKTQLYAEYSVVKDKDGTAQLGAESQLKGQRVQATSVGMVYKF